MSELLKQNYENWVETWKSNKMTEIQFQELYTQKPQPLKIGDMIELKSDRKFYEILEFLEEPRGTIKIREISLFSWRVRFINYGQINKIL